VTPRVLCDTNVPVSAFIAGGPPSRVVEAAIEARIELVLADPVIDELERVLRTKLGFTAERIRGAIALLSELAGTRVPAPTRQPAALTGDPADDLILACAIEANVEIVVSGDRRHLLPLGHCGAVRIITPQKLLAELANG
jgi:uncharacterized protein